MALTARTISTLGSGIARYFFVLALMSALSIPAAMGQTAGSSSGTMAPGATTVTPPGAAFVGVASGSPNQRLLNTPDKLQYNEYITDVIRVWNKSGGILPQVRTAVSLEKGEAEAVIKMVGGNEVEFIIVTTTRRQMPSIRALIGNLDHPSKPKRTRPVYDPFLLSHRKASDVVAILRGLNIRKDATLFADDPSNRIYTDAPDAFAEYILAFDVPVKQIKLLVQVIQIAEHDKKKVGLDWDAWKRNMGGQFGLTFNAFEGGDVFSRLDGLLATDASALADFLNYTAQRGSAEIRDQAFITASNSKLGMFSESTTRTDFPVYEVSASTPMAIAETNALFQEFPEFPTRTVMLAPQSRSKRLTPRATEGLSISVTPTIGTTSVLLELAIEANLTTGFDSLDQPIVSTRKAGTSITLPVFEVTPDELKDDLEAESLQPSIDEWSPFVVASFEETTLLRGNRGFPGLRDVPFVRKLAGVQSKIQENSKLWVIIVPQAGLYMDEPTEVDLETGLTIRAYDEAEISESSKNKYE